MAAPASPTQLNETISEVNVFAFTHNNTSPSGPLLFVCSILLLALGTAISITYTVAARRPAAGSNSWTGQTHERGQQGRRQGHPRGGLGIERPLGVDASKLIRLVCSTWPVTYPLSPTPGNETSRASRQQGADRGVMRPAGRPATTHLNGESSEAHLLRFVCWHVFVFRFVLLWLVVS